MDTHTKNYVPVQNQVSILIQKNQYHKWKEDVHVKVSGYSKGIRFLVVFYDKRDLFPQQQAKPNIHKFYAHTLISEFYVSTY